VRGQARRRRGQVQPPHIDRHEVRLAYRGLDGVGRSTTIRFSPQPSRLEAGCATFDLRVPSGGEAEVAVEVQPSVGGTAPPRRPNRRAPAQTEDDYSAAGRRG